MGSQTLSPLGRKFKLITNHRPLTWLFSIKDIDNRLARWRLKQEEYDYEIIYKPDKINKNADALTRIKINHDESVDLNKQKSLPKQFHAITIKSRFLINNY